MSNDTLPEIRFPGFTEDWEERKLGDIFVYKQGQQVPVENQFTKRGKNRHRFIRIVDLTTNNEAPRYIEYSGDNIISSTDLFMIRYGQPGVIGYGYEGVIANNLFKLIPKIETYNLFFKYILDSMYPKIQSLSSSTTMPAISFKSLDVLAVRYPDKKEQEKIGSFFAQLDNTIAHHQRKLDLLKETKKGFLQKMFPKNGAKVPEIRFPGFTEDWEQRKLGDLTTWTKGQGLTKEDLNKERDGSEAVHYADLYKFSPVMHEVIHWTNSDDGRIIPDNSLLFPASDVTPVGLARTSTLRLSGVKAGGDVIIGQLNESINSSFMSYQINANSKKILPLITGTTVKHIQAKSLATVSVSITNMAEQTAIAGIFEQLDDTITLHQRKLDLLKETKKGFLQKMFV
ncbi:restriction endonuclease subunit S [Enterococcus faecium]|nr:restriction endonuclease subunit S [Enterococcus faecium]